MAFDHSILTDIEALRGVLRTYDSCLIAYSGGVDSVLLAKVAHEELGERMLAVIADSPSLPRRELQEAQAIAARYGFPLEVIRTTEFEQATYSANPVNRCYFCKHELFSHLKLLALERGFSIIAYGENASDVGDWRPGGQAAEQFAVRAPLKEAGLDKKSIRECSRRLGLPTAEKPAMPCLSSRIPYGEQVTREKVGMVEKAESVLRDAGFREVRVRHHEAGPMARIEVMPEEIRRLQSAETFEPILSSLTAIGYAHVEVDETGYRRGNLNPAGIAD